jgi:hypothetical protein
MTRRILPLFVMALVSAGVGAQGPKTIPPQQRGELYKRNRPVIERLVAKTVESSKAPNNPVTRAKTYYDLLLDFNKELRDARSAGDDARVKELSSHLVTLLDRGLGPTLKKAHEEMGGAGQTDNENYQKVRDDLIAQVDALLGVVDDPGAKKSLDDARTGLKQRVASKSKE